MSAMKQPIPPHAASAPTTREAPGAAPPAASASGPPRQQLEWVQSLPLPLPVPLLVRRHLARGQSTVEYALLVVGIATLALLVLAWASSTGVVGALFDRVFRWVTGRVG